MIRPDNAALARFQPVGLIAIEVLHDSKGALSCVTCHDPHARASKDRPGLRDGLPPCHEVLAETACPVSPRAGCMDCHMPKVDAGQRVLFTDHWIRIRKAIGTLPPS